MLVFVENAIMSLTERRSKLFVSGRSQVSGVTKTILFRSLPRAISIHSSSVGQVKESRQCISSP